MPYFKNEKLLFIHIPKTGGTSVENYFSTRCNIKLNNSSLYGFLKKQTNIIINSSMQHMTYKTILKYKEDFDIEFENVKILTIVRNPYERIISDLFFLKKINVNTSKKDVYDIINKYILSDDVDNHNIPQYKFITDNDEIIPNIYILHTENLCNDMHNIGYNDFNIHIQKNEKNVDYYEYLNNDSIKLINSFYHEDFMLFNYKKKDTI